MTGLEQGVTRLQVRAGAPPSPVELLRHYQYRTELGTLGKVWQDWENWFHDLSETHTALAPLALLRSSRPEQAWVNTAASVLPLPHPAQRDTFLDAGSLTLHRIAECFQLRYDRPRQGAPEPTIDRATSDAREDR